MPQRAPLPPYLHNTDPMEWEDIPLQVALLTMEIVQLRQTLAAMLDRHDEIDAQKFDVLVGIGDEWLMIQPQPK
jgi:hypothetical protein